MTQRTDHECKRCGLCCANVGTIWVHSKHPVIKAMIKAIVDRPEKRILKQSSDKIIPVNAFFRDGGPCDMALVQANGQTVCKIQKWLGAKWKPESCQDYPFDDDGDDNRCFREVAEAGK